MVMYSIVTPVFNSFELMTKYFDSLEKQTFKDFEVILVDDCSSDDSYDKLKNYCQTTHLSVTLLKTEVNSGPGVARNLGIDVAQGKWLTFIDNDDWIEYDMLEQVNAVLSNNSVDCVIFDYFIKKGEETIFSKSMYHGENGLLSLSDCIKYVRNHTFCKVYNLEKCRKNNIRFPAVRRCEDVAFVCQAIDACESAYYLKKPMYNYCRRITSLSNNNKLDESDMVKAFSCLEQSLGTKYPEELKVKSVTDLFYGAVLMMCKAGKSNSEIRKHITICSAKYPGWINTDIVKYVGRVKGLFLKLIFKKQIVLLKILSRLHTRMIG